MPFLHDIIMQIELPFLVKDNNTIFAALGADPFKEVRYILVHLLCVGFVYNEK